MEVRVTFDPTGRMGLTGLETTTTGLGTAWKMRTSLFYYKNYVATQQQMSIGGNPELQKYCSY